MEYAGNATNNGLKTVDEAAAMDETEMATPHALDYVSQIDVIWRYFIISAVF